MIEDAVRVNLTPPAPRSGAERGEQASHAALSDVEKGVALPDLPRSAPERGLGGGVTPVPAPVVVRRYVRFAQGMARAVEEPVIAEMRLRIVVDGAEVVELMC